MRMTLEVTDVASAEHAKEMCDAYITSMTRDAKPKLHRTAPAPTAEDGEEEDEAPAAKPKRGSRKAATKEAATPKAATKSRPAALDLDEEDGEDGAEEDGAEEDEAPAAKGKGKSLDDILNGPSKSSTNFKSREYKKTRDELRAEAREFVKAKGNDDDAVEALTELLVERYNVESIAEVPEEKLGDCYAALLHFKNVSSKK